MRVDQMKLAEITQKNGAVSNGSSHHTVHGKEMTKEVEVSSGKAFQIKKDTIYEKPQTLLEEIQEEASLDENTAKSRHNTMKLLSNSMSPEDYEKYKEEGYSFDEDDSKTILTVVDKIKIELAEAGVDVSYMGGSPSLEALEAYGASIVEANRIAECLQEWNLPQSMENVWDMQKTIEMANSISALSDSAIKYLMNNEQKSSIEGIYYAQSAAVEGYGTAKLSEEVAKELEESMEKIIVQAGLLVNEESLEASKWMIANDIDFTEKNLRKVCELRSLSFPLDPKLIFQGIKEAFDQGLRPQDAAMISEESSYAKAKTCEEVVHQATDEDLQNLISKGKEQTIENLQIEINLRNSKSEETKEEERESHLNQEETISFLTAKRQLEEVRLLMTTEANIRMIRKGIAIDTKPLEKLVSELKEQENQYYEIVLGADSEVTESQKDCFRQTMDILVEMGRAPAYVLAHTDFQNQNFTVRHLSEEAVQLKAKMEEANQLYDRLRTEVRPDLGDRIQKAFQNVDAILNDLSLETNEENQRAVRILAYNQMEITQERIFQIKAVDEEVQRLFKNMTAPVVAELIKEKKNPLDLKLTELNQLAMEIKAKRPNQEAEKYSEYLYKLERNSEIDEDERASYIGIFRLLHQIETGDSAAVGALYQQGMDLTMRNLLTASRNLKKEGMEYQVDDHFGGVEVSNEKNIVDQIEMAFQMNLVHDAVEMLSPEALRTAIEGENWENQSLEQLVGHLKQADCKEEQLEYDMEKLEWLAETKDVEEEVYRALERFDIPNSPANVLAMQQIYQYPNQVYRKLFSSRNEKFYKEDGSINFEEIKEDLIRQFGEAMESPEDMAKAQKNLEEVASNIMKTMLTSEEKVTSLDLREMRSVQQQFQLFTTMAKKEEYHIPVLVKGEYGDMSLKIVSGSEEKGMVDIMFSLSALGSVAAKLKLEGGQLSAVIATNQKSTKDGFLVIEEELEDSFCKIAGVEQAKFTMIYDAKMDTRMIAAKNALEKDEMEAEKRVNESGEESDTSTRTLYLLAKNFLKQLNRL